MTTITRRRDGDPVRAFSNGRVAYWTSGVPGEGTRIFTRPRNGQTAEGLAAELRSELGTPSLAKGGRALVQMFIAWRDAQPAEHPTTRKYLGAANNHILPAVGAVMIRDLALADLLTVVERSLAAGLTENTVRSIVTAFRSVITWGTERGWFGSRQPFGPPAQLNAAVQRTIRRHFDAAQAQEPSRTIGVDSVSTPAEIKAFAELMDDPLDGTGRYVRLLASSGLRIAEFVALRVEDIDLVHMRVNVERQGRRDRTWSSVEPASATGTSVWTSRLKGRRNRTVQVWESARPSLEWLVANAVDGWLVPPSKGQAWWLDSLNKQLNKACAQLGWPDRQRIHRLRHFYATYCLAAAPTGYGFDIADVSRWLGHSSIAVTMDMYQHSTPGADDRAQHVSARPLI